MLLQQVVPYPPAEASLSLEGGGGVTHKVFHHLSVGGARAAGAI